MLYPKVMDGDRICYWKWDRQMKIQGSENVLDLFYTWTAQITQNYLGQNYGYCKCRVLNQVTPNTNGKEMKNNSNDAQNTDQMWEHYQKNYLESIIFIIDYY